MALNNKDPQNESGYQRIFKKLSNEIIDLKKLISGNPSTKKVFNPYKNYNKL